MWYTVMSCTFFLSSRPFYSNIFRYVCAVFLLENRSRGGGIVARRGKGGGGGGGRHEYIILLGYHSRGGSKDSRGGGGGGGGKIPTKRNPDVHFVSTLTLQLLHACTRIDYWFIVLH